MMAAAQNATAKPLQKVDFTSSSRHHATNANGRTEAAPRLFAGLPAMDGRSVELNQRIRLVIAVVVAVIAVVGMAIHLVAGCIASPHAPGGTTAKDSPPLITCISTAPRFRNYQQNSGLPSQAIQELSIQQRDPQRTDRFRMRNDDGTRNSASTLVMGLAAAALVIFGLMLFWPSDRSATNVTDNTRVQTTPVPTTPPASKPGTDTTPTTPPVKAPAQ
jgi:hypothetical protein